MRVFLRVFWPLLVSFLSVLAWGAPGPIVASSLRSPFTDYTASVLIYGLLVAFLVITLLAGGFLVLNLGLLSKRKEDRVGGRTPSDVGILKHSNWPEEPYDEVKLPAEEPLEEIRRTEAVRPLANKLRKEPDQAA